MATARAESFQRAFPGLRYADTTPWDTAPENPTVPVLSPEQLAHMTPLQRELMSLGAIPDDGCVRVYHRQLGRLFKCNYSGEWSEIPVPAR